VDLVDLIQEKRFFGQEFLTWLWYKSEERGGAVNLPGSGDILVVFEKHMLLEYGEGESNESLVCRGLRTELQEARTGLQMAKKVEQARIRIGRGDYEWILTLRGTLLELRNMRPPKTGSAAEDGDEQLAVEGRMLERIGLIEEAVRMVNELFRFYLRLRVRQEWETEDLPRIREWVGKAKVKANIEH